MLLTSVTVVAANTAVGVGVGIDVGVAPALSCLVLPYLVSSCRALISRRIVLLAAVLCFRACGGPAGEAAEERSLRECECSFFSLPC